MYYCFLRIFVELSLKITKTLINKPITSKYFYRYNLREKEKTYRCDYETPSGGTWPNKQINFVFRLLSAIYTFFAFLVAICLIPWLFTMFICKYNQSHFNIFIVNHSLYLSHKGCLLLSSVRCNLILRNSQ